jgi:hypothetical protein
MPRTRELIESRLSKYQGNDQQREQTLKQLFTEAGCDEQHLSEQPVKGSKLPNFVCLLPALPIASLSSEPTSIPFPQAMA